MSATLFFRLVVSYCLSLPCASSELNTAVPGMTNAPSALSYAYGIAISEICDPPVSSHERVSSAARLSRRVSVCAASLLHVRRCNLQVGSRRGREVVTAAVRPPSVCDLSTMRTLRPRAISRVTFWAGCASWRSNTTNLACCGRVSSRTSPRPTGGRLTSQEHGVAQRRLRGR